MGIAERKAREKEELRGKIISAALNMFIEEGYAKVSIRKIAERVEYSPATIYLYFQNKDELMFFVQQEAFDQFFEILAPVLSLQDPIEQLRFMGRTYMDFGISNPELYDLMFMLQAPMNVDEVKEQGWECGFETFHLLEVVIQNCQRVGYFAEKESHIAAIENWSMVHGMLSLFLRDRFDMMPKENRKELMYQTLESHLELIKSLKS